MERRRLKQGLVQIYTGDGKGKTTAALGLALRAVGHGLHVLMVQFAKGTGYSGELFSCERLYPNLTIEEFGKGCRLSSLIKNGYLDCQGCGECFIQKGKGSKEDYQAAAFALKRAREAIEGDAYDLIILDEINIALYFELIELEDILALIEAKKDHCELIITGRMAHPDVLAKADLVTEMKAIKHPYEQGVEGRWGIEY